jgi:hypothetical protein
MDAMFPTFEAFRYCQALICMRMRSSHFCSFSLRLNDSVFIDIGQFFNTAVRGLVCIMDHAYKIGFFLSFPTSAHFLSTIKNFLNKIAFGFQQVNNVK